MKNKLITTIRDVPIAGKSYEEYIEAVADRLLSEGVLVPPVKVGDTVYAAIFPIFEDDPENGEVYEWSIKGVAYECGEWWIESEDDEWYKLGDNLCKLTREEAEKVLAERN